MAFQMFNNSIFSVCLVFTKTLVRSLVKKLLPKLLQNIQLNFCQNWIINYNVNSIILYPSVVVVVVVIVFKQHVFPKVATGLVITFRTKKK